MDLDTDVYHVYAANGLLLKRINYSAYRQKYGTPVAQSGNGRLIAFRRTNTYLQIMSGDKLMGTKAVPRALTFSLLEMTPSGMRFIKIVNVFEGLAKSLKQAGIDQVEFASETEWLYCETFKEMQRRLNVQLEVNDVADVCIKLWPKK